LVARVKIDDLATYVVNSIPVSASPSDWQSVTYSLDWYCF